MYTHNLDPVLLDFGILVIRWYSLAYIFGIILGWWVGKKIARHIIKTTSLKFKLSYFDDLISYLIDFKYQYIIKNRAGRVPSGLESTCSDCAGLVYG